MYPEELTTPMRLELTNAGFEDLKTADAVDNLLKDQKGTASVVINSVCGCAAGTARRGVRLAMQNSNKLLDTLATVFAGVDQAAVANVSEYAASYPPSSPSIALVKDGELVHFVERHQIEGRSAEMIANHLSSVFEEYC